MLQAIIGAATGVWAIGVALLIARLMVGLKIVARLRHSFEPFTDLPPEITDRLRRTLGVPREHNDLVAANQVIVRDEKHRRRLDVVAYVNGLPLAVFELKKAGGSDGSREAYQQLQTYRREFGATALAPALPAAALMLANVLGSFPVDGAAPDGLPLVPDRLALGESQLALDEILLQIDPRGDERQTPFLGPAPKLVNLRPMQ